MFAGQRERHDSQHCRDVAARMDDRFGDDDAKLLRAEG